MSYNSSGSHRSGGSWSRSSSNSYNSSDQIHSASSVNHSVSSKKSYSNDFHTNMSIPNAPSITIKTFHGYVTRLHDSWGVIENDIQFSFNVCEKEIPKLNDMVTVEASPGSGLYKWKGIKVFPCGNGRDYSNSKSISGSRSDSDIKRNKRCNRSRERSRDRRYDESDRKRFKCDDRNDKLREPDKEIHREREKYKDHKKSLVGRSRTPNKRKYVRYSVKVPAAVLNLSSAEFITLKRRYPSLYIPPDFFWSTFGWCETLPLSRPYTLDKPCAFHVMDTECDMPVKNESVYDPPDLDYTFSAKVMLMAIPSLNEIYEQTICLAEDVPKEEEKTFIHLTRLIKFLVGCRSKADGPPIAIGGPWSPSLDGENPKTNPTVLISTAIRTCRALTGIDLSSCSRWYRFMEVYYHRSESIYKGKTIPAHVETVVFFLPEMWTCMPTSLEWESVRMKYQQLLQDKLNPSPIAEEDITQTPLSDLPADIDKEEDLVVIDKCEEKVEQTHYSKLNPETMKVNDLRQELEARSLSTKGLKPQLIQRLELALRKEKDAEMESSSKSNFLDKFMTECIAVEINDIKIEEELKVVDEVKVTDDIEEPADVHDKTTPNEEDIRTVTPMVDQVALENKYVLPTLPHVIIHPSKTAKSGKFECQLLSLASLLDYRLSENKEHSFELFLFSEMFNEMLERDFGYAIYKALCTFKEEKDEREQMKLEKDSSENELIENNENVKKDTESVHCEVREESVKSKLVNAEEDKKQDPTKFVTRDPFLLLSFVFFDRTRCGYILDRDLETLLSSLGLQLSRHQIKKLISRVCNKDKLQYRTLTDGLENGDDEHKNKNTDCNADISGNRKYFPMSMNEGNECTINNTDSSHQESSSTFNKLINIGGVFINVGNTLVSLNRSETSRLETEKQLSSCRTEIDTLKDSLNKSSEKEKKAYEDARTYREKLDVASKDKLILTNKVRMYYKALMNIKDTIQLIETKDKSSVPRKENIDKDEGKDWNKNKKMANEISNGKFETAKGSVLHEATQCNTDESTSQNVQEEKPKIEASLSQNVQEEGPKIEANTAQIES